MKNIKFLLVIAAVLPGLALAGSNTNKGANPNGKPFFELAGQIVEIEGEVSTLQDQVDALVGRVDTIEGAQAAMTTAIEDLQAENVTLQAQIDANAADVDSLETQISVLNSAILDLQSEIEANGDADGLLQAQVNDLEGQVTALSLSIDTLGGNLQASIDNNAALIVILGQEIDALEAGKQDAPISSCPSGQVITQINQNGSVVCGVLSGTSGAISTYYVLSRTQYPNWGNNDTTCNYVGGTQNYSCYIPPGYTTDVRATCNPGDRAMGMGYSGGSGWEYLSLYAVADFGRMYVRNNNSYWTSTAAVLTCLHQN